MARDGLSDHTRKPQPTGEPVDDGASLDEPAQAAGANGAGRGDGIRGDEDRANGQPTAGATEGGAPPATTERPDRPAGADEPPAGLEPGAVTGVEEPGADEDPELAELERSLSSDGTPPDETSPPASPPRRGGRLAGRRPPRPRMKKLRIAIVLAGLGLLAGVSWVFGIMMAVASDLPALEQRAEFIRAENSVVVDRNGQELATLTNNEGRILLDSSEIALSMKQAVVAIEDERFYEHRGVDYRGIARAFYHDVTTQSMDQGASTITQQFVKNALEAQQSRTVFQKLREAALAYHLERQWSKEKILTEYLNTVYFGEGAHGIEAAARTFFGHAHPGCGSDGGDPCASKLLVHEAALLAGIIASPTAYSPRANPDVALRQRDIVLDKMQEQNVISAEERERYSNEPLPSPSQIQPPAEESEAPYFTSWLRQQIVDRYGPGQAFGGGLHIVSTLDLELQQETEAIVERHLGFMEPTASVVVLDNETAGVLAMVGGTDFEEAPFNLATQGHRQPGSAIKPFTLVAALENGYTTSDVFSSQPREFKFVPEGHDEPEIFEVSNYDDSYRGSATLADATTFSDNAVYADLGLTLGTRTVAQTARRMGIETPVSTNPAMTLGGLAEGLTPLEMAHAYETLAQDGWRVSGSMAERAGGVVAIEAVLNRPDGSPVADQTGANGINRPEGRKVLEPEVAEEAVGALSSVIAGGTGRRALIPGVDAFGKTGTTDDNADAWFVGSTEEVTVAVWVGHPDSNEPMRTEFQGQPVDGGTIPTLVWRDVVMAYMNLLSSRGEAPEESDAPVEPAPAPDPAPEPAPVPAQEPAPAPAPEAGAQQAQPAQQPQQAPAPPPVDEGGVVAE